MWGDRSRQRRVVAIALTILVVASSVAPVAVASGASPASNAHERADTAIADTAMVDSATNVERVGGNAGDPDPVSVSVDAPDSVTIGESFSIRMDARNDGTKAGAWSTITMSSPTLDESDDGEQVSVTGHDLDYSVVTAPGEDLVDDSGSTITADYAAVEAGTDGEGTWGSGESNYLEATFTPEETGTFVVYARVTLTEDGDTSTTYTAPGSSSVEDQQGYAVYRITVDVREKANVDASLSDYDQDAGTYVVGDDIDADVRVENTGNREHTFFVGYSARGPDGEWYSNDGTTGEAVTLDPGESTRVYFDFDAESDQPTGTYDARVSVWKESDRDSLSTRLDRRDASSAFAVEARDVDGSVLEMTTVESTKQPGESVSSDVTVENTGNVEHTFYVGYSARGPDDNWYSNDGTSGQTVTLAPGETRTLEPVLDVTESMPDGQYNLRASIWKESNADDLQTRLGDVVDEDVFEVESGTIAGEIDAFYFSGGTYERGDNVTARAVVENTGTVEHTYFVGYSVRGPDGNWYSNDDTTGRTVTLEPGQEETVDLSWTVDSDVENGEYDVVTKVWNESDRDNLEESFDTVWRNDSVTVAAPDVSPSDVEYTVETVNGQTAGEDGVFDLEDFRVETMTVEIARDDGTPVSGLSPTLQTTREDVSMTATEESPGVYRFEPETGDVVTTTAYKEFFVSFDAASDRANVEVAMNTDRTPIAAPLEGWMVHGIEHEVVVDGERYTAVMASPYDEDGVESEITAWIAYDDQGNLVRDDAVVEKVAMTAHVSHVMRNEETMEQFFAEDYPGGLEEVLGASHLLQWSVTVRDTSASMLGSIAASYATGGASAVTVGGSSVSTMSTKEAMKASGKEIGKKVLLQMREQYGDQLKSELGNDLFGTYHTSMRAAAHDELRESIRQSERVGEILAAREDGSVWRYETARETWKMYNESMVDGILWSEVRVQTMPSGAPEEQIKSIGTNFAEGATGAPVTAFADLMASGDLGDGYERALRKTADHRREFQLDSKSIRVFSPQVQERAIAATDGEGYQEPQTDSTVEASISLVDAPTGSVVAGEWANATVEVTNQDDESQRLFVGYSTRTDSESGPLYFSNRGSTGHWIVLGPGETTETEVAWRVQESAPDDQSYDAIVAVWDEFPSQDATRLDGETELESFSVVEGADLSVVDVTVPEEATVGQPTTVSVAVRNDGAREGEDVVTLRVDGERAVQALAVVEAGDTETTQLTYEFETAGERDVSVAGTTATIDVTESETTTEDEQPTTAEDDVTTSEGGASTTDRSGTATGGDGDDEDVATDENADGDAAGEDAASESGDADAAKATAEDAVEDAKAEGEDLADDAPTPGFGPVLMLVALLVVVVRLRRTN